MALPVAYHIYVAFNITVSDALHRRVPRFERARRMAFDLAVADIAKGRAQGEHVFTSPINQRRYYMLQRPGYALYYSVDPRQPQSLVFEEFLSADEGELIMDIFAGHPELPEAN